MNKRGTSNKGETFAITRVQHEEIIGKLDKNLRCVGNYKNGIIVVDYYFVWWIKLLTLVMLPVLPLFFGLRNIGELKEEVSIIFGKEALYSEEIVRTTRDKTNKFSRLEDIYYKSKLN